ncbi:hypothetical protein OEB99_04435 [Actinotalea sp. M2MS4P-6]|uniref:NifB/NifX family molybdenum-iron cluster-binding protein n=1 Tax=Actinotalea sp. M2MS4P-6 TaxID=2983762 RepID=UPI0021E4ABB0|nr:NifB/NifX family molybdenum-iron cluster-binding protein [Actinotalea sp. M2MS4P-6]MCV2393547.1 hypothetical protein [Actinotalea sp. M2MS4P-6]
MSEQGGVVVCVPVTGDRQVDHSWGKATVVATATVRDGAVVSWTEDAVGWDVLHDEGPHGSHHGRIARFLLGKGAQAVAASHMGPPMVNMLGKMGLVVALGAQGSAEDAVVEVAGRVTGDVTPVEPAAEDMQGC